MIIKIEFALENETISLISFSQTQKTIRLSMRERKKAKTKEFQLKTHR